MERQALPARGIAFAALFLTASFAAAGNETDRRQQALERLRSEISTQAAGSSQPVQDAIARYADSTLSSVSLDTNDDALPPRPRDIDDAEWASLQRYLQGNALAQHPAERGRYELQLVDLDDDGRRDLVLSYYSGGTGLYSHNATLARDDALGFRTAEGGPDGTGIAYPINGRGTVGSSPATSLLPLAG